MKEAISPLEQIMKGLGHSKLEMARALEVSQLMISDICNGITVGEKAYQTLVRRFKLDIELEHLINAQKRFCAVKQAERIEVHLRGREGRAKAADESKKEEPKEG